MNLVLVTFLTLAVVYLFIKICEALSLPRVLSPLMVGIVLGIPQIKSQLFNQLSLDFFNGLSDIGLILLLFYVGLEFDVHKLKKSSRQMISVALLSAVVPFALGFFATRLIGFSWKHAFVMGASLSVTAETIAIALLEEENMLDTKVGRTIIGAGIMDDVVEVLIISLISLFVTTKEVFSIGILEILLNFVLLIGLMIAIRFLFIPLIMRFLSEETEKQKYDLFTASIILVLAIAVLTNYLKLSFAVGALIAGIFIRYALEQKGSKGRKEESEIDDMIKTVTFGFMMFFFFIWIGMNTDIEHIFRNPLLGIILTVIALFGKWVGAVIGYVSVSNGKFYEANIVGWGMNSKGAIELVAAEIARSHGLITPEIFSAIVFMTFFSMIISPIVLNYLIRHKKHRFL
ncbi:hypothetical protein COY95_04150 [Candidatus Woesearchaeota archaeon CG_4_10_14_0_8_um_filter_47_5]|nr:MAG: hypothetical protein COY95_04150 [Candidatus Woesearchaeota archaeon CG_4_10_14_0_8_um_filter_47_5]